MPRYDYRCGDCGTLFEIKLSMSEYSAGPEVRCPDCGSAEPERAFSSFGVITGGRGVSGAASRASAASCGHAGFT